MSSNENKTKKQCELFFFFLKIEPTKVDKRIKADELRYETNTPMHNTEKNRQGFLCLRNCGRMLLLLDSGETMRLKIKMKFEKLYLY